MDNKHNFFDRITLNGWLPGVIFWGLIFMPTDHLEYADSMISNFNQIVFLTMYICFGFIICSKKALDIAFVKIPVRWIFAFVILYIVEVKMHATTPVEYILSTTALLVFFKTIYEVWNIISEKLNRYNI